MADLPTVVNDEFPLKRLECQYFEICKYYSSDQCKFNLPCYARMNIGNNQVKVRTLLRNMIEPYVQMGALELQIKFINEIGGNNDKEQEE